MTYTACAHRFRRVRRWPIKLRWRCVSCGMVTSYYGSVDRAMGRPIHARMAVAMKGVNTAPAPDTTSGADPVP